MALQESAAAGIAGWIPAKDWLRHYRRDWLGRDLLAGITAGAVVIPPAMG
jgi:MFS superfamily sulfate permease-like transporter